MKRITWFILFLVMGVSCLDQPDCYRQNLNFIGISFRKLFDGKADTVQLDQVLIDGNNSGLDFKLGYTTIPVELNYLNKEITLKISGFLKDDELTLSYQSRTQFVSAECGERFIVSGLKIKSYTGSFNDSVRVVSDVPANTAGTNIVIYRCPRPNTIRFSFQQLFMDLDSVGKPDERVIKTIDFNTTKFRYVSPAKSVVLPLDSSANSISYDFKFDTEQSNVSFEYQKEKLSSGGS